MGLSCTKTFALENVTNVPSDPTTNFAVLKLLTSTNSSKLYPDTLLWIEGYLVCISDIKFFLIELSVSKIIPLVQGVLFQNMMPQQVPI